LEKWLTPEAEEEWKKLVAIKDRILPEDVAKLVLFLASSDSSMITGQSFVIDAGRT
jgi:NAD(P)-dependent dehydrogenase (short-subunit alcohol dehydrogenase family)